MFDVKKCGRITNRHKHAAAQSVVFYMEIGNAAKGKTHETIESTNQLAYQFLMQPGD